MLSSPPHPPLIYDEWTCNHSCLCIHLIFFLVRLSASFQDFAIFFSFLFNVQILKNLLQLLMETDSLTICAQALTMKRAQCQLSLMVRRNEWRMIPSSKNQSNTGKEKPRVYVTRWISYWEDDLRSSIIGVLFSVLASAAPILKTLVFMSLAFWLLTVFKPF